jgi:hypothetical protein
MNKINYNEVSLTLVYKGMFEKYRCYLVAFEE